MKSGFIIILVLGLCVTAGLVIAGCTQQSSTIPTTTAPVTSSTTQPNQTGTTGIANPASVNCVNIGGTLQIKNSPAGQYGMCTFPNGTSCEEWALFHGEGCQAANVTS